MRSKRSYIEAAPRPRYKARDVIETYVDRGGHPMTPQIVVSFPPGTPVETVPEVIDALRNAYLAGRQDAIADLAAERAGQ